MSRTLITGGARSGKSACAEQLAVQSGRPVIYIATAQAHDSEMLARIALHQERREQGWITVEEPLALGDAIARYSTADNLLLVDCLTVWLSNLLFCEPREFPEVGHINPPAAFGDQRSSFLQALDQAPGEILMVSNEVGLGVVPQGAVSRWFVDEAGRLNQAVAARCERALFVVAGLPLVLKGPPC